MASLEPSFRRGPGGRLLLTDSTEVKIIKNQHRERDLAKPRPAATVRKEAEEMVKKAGGDIKNSKHLLGCFEIQFGCFRGMTFKWILENSPGYVGYLVAGMEKDETEPTDNRWINKMALKKYVELWPEGRELVQIKKKQSSTPRIPMKIKGVSPTAQTTMSEMSDEELLSATQEMEQKMTTGYQTSQGVPAQSSRELFVPTVSAQRKALLSGPALKTSPAIKTSSPPVQTSTVPTPLVMVTSKPMTATLSLQEVKGTLSSSPVLPVSDSHLQLPVAQQSVDSQSMVQTPPDTYNQQANEDLCLPARWKKTLPKVDQQWISKVLFRWTKTGGVELVPEHLTQLWWYPPQPAVAVNSIPGVDRYFARPLFLWMPRKQWKVKLYCPQPGCEKQELASAGINQKVRQVTDIDGFYNMACDNLECMKCRRRVLSWSHAILSQLDVGHRTQFPCILTAKLACDMKVVRLLRNRGLGNSCSQIQKKLEEQHGERWLQNVLHYLTDCSGFSSAADSSLLVSPTFAEPPERAALPKHRWLMQIYIQDVLLRLDEMKAGITSVFGRILKIDSTKKVVKKLAGRPAKTALWCTNVGNEHGQILTSVMTTGEGHGLTPMLVGVLNRFTKAQVSSPEIIYVDRDCCGASPLRQVLTASAWKTMIRLDIWHFMRRIATGCTTDSHQLYSSFMGLLSNCIFHWDEQDLSSLVKSKRNELTAQHLFIKSDAGIMKYLSRYELALHCRRKTRGVAETTQLISKLIDTFSGERGRDTLGVPLINHSRMTSIWEAQKKHIACIQDPPGVSLYTRTGSTKKGGIELPNFRCARGSTSLESFHLHLNRFIPGTLASDVLFQAYMVDGLHRWNEDRGRAATSTATDHQSYSGLLRHTANVLGLQVLKRKVAPIYNEPRKYTGELIGIEYLYSQTGKVLEDYMKAIETLESTQEDELIGTGEEDELLQDTDQIDDLTVSTVGLKESADIVLETPTTLPVPQGTEQPHPSSSTQTQAVEPILKIPTSEDYEAMMRDTVDRQQSVHQVPVPVLQEESSSEVGREGIDSESESDQSVHQVPVPVLQEESSSEVGREGIDSESESDQSVHQVPVPVLQEESSSEVAREEVDSESESDESVGPDSIPGYGRVQELAAYLVGLRHNTYLTNAQVARLIQLWNALPDYDKAPTVFPERFSKEARGRYKAKKSVRNVVPGVESTERSMRGGPGAVPASWPSANRYTEAIIIRLLSLLPRNRTRFDDVTKAYYDIRHLVLQNGRAVLETSIQLPEISRGTLTQWYTKRGKALDKLVVTQGVRFVQPSQTTSLGIPAAVDKPTQLPTGRTEPHIFPCPTNTAGLARMKGQKKNSSHPSQVVTQSSPGQPTVPSNAAESTYPLTTPKSTSTLTAPQTTYNLTAPQVTYSFTVPQSACHVVVPMSSHSLAVPQSTNPLNVPQSTSPLLASQSTYSIIASHPTCQVIAPESSALVSTSQSICHIPAQQSTPAGPAQQSAIPVRTTPIAPLQMLTVNTDGQLYQLSQASQAGEMSVLSTAVPYTTQRYRKRKLEKEKEGIVKRKYDRKKTPTCKQCGQERIPPVHVQYFMNWFCGATATISFEDWKDEMARKGYGRKPKH